jgi:small GTP-binding protein
MARLPSSQSSFSFASSHHYNTTETMSTRSTNTRSRSAAPRSKSPGLPPRFSKQPTRTYSRSISPCRPNLDSTPVKAASKAPKANTPAELRSDLVNFIDEHPNGSEIELKRKLEAYAQTPGADMNDVLLQFGAMSCGANVKQKYKINLIGNAGVGKTSLVKHLQHLGFQEKYDTTNGANVTDVWFWTNKGYAFQVQLWDCSGVEKAQGIGSGYYIGSDGCLLMLDVGHPLSYKYQTLDLWHKEFTRVCPGAPVVVLGNKVDDKHKKFKPSKDTFLRKKCLPYYEVSVKNGLNTTAGFLSLVRLLTGDKTIQFISHSAQMPPLH